MPPGIDRRTFLARGAAGLGGLVLAGCGVPSPREPSGPRSLVPPASPQAFVPVRISRDRIVRTQVGLRPYRDAGFVVRGERLAGKVVIHNYGHGGGGLSLSWGSSSLAVAEAVATTEADDFAVIGAGVMGLTTALLLQERGRQATIYARDLPPGTTSNVAAGQWSPFSVFNRDVVSPSFLRSFDRAARIAHRRFDRMSGSRYGIRWLDNYVLAASPEPRDRGGLEDLFGGEEILGPGEHPFDSPWVRRFRTMLIEPDRLLAELQRDFLLRGGRIQAREFRDQSELAALPEPVIMNCTGLGSRDLFGDQELTPIKGELVILEPQLQVDYLLLAGGFYMFPRGDGVVLGGSFERGEWSLEPTPGVVERILEGNRMMFEGVG
jgi:D-amino-acid oxidase